MATQTQSHKYLTLETVAVGVASGNDITEVREQLKHLIGQRAIINAAKVIKKIVRHEHLKLFVSADDSRLTAFAEFTRAKEAKKVLERKVRKSSNIAVIGELQSFGYRSVCLINCRLVEGVIPSKQFDKCNLN